MLLASLGTCIHGCKHIHTNKINLRKINEKTKLTYKDAGLNYTISGTI